MEDPIDKRCGEIFLTIDGNILFFCTLCDDNKYPSYDNYVEHLHQHILNSDEKFDMRKSEQYDTFFNPLSDGENNEFEDIKPLEIVEAIEAIEICTRLEAEEIEWGTQDEDETPISSPSTTTPDKDHVAENMSFVNVRFTMEDGKFQCPHCSFSCTHKTYIRRHIQRHSDYKPHQCAECDKAFHTRTELNIHTRSHTGERPYICPICNMGFTTSNKRKSHIQTHKDLPITKKTEFIETRPKKPVVEKLKWDEHEAHTKEALNNKEEIVQLRPVNVRNTTKERNFKCPHCDFACSDKSNLRGHIRRHSTNKPFKCTECEKAFHTRTELKTHMRSHTGECPFLCTICGRAYSTSSKLYSHLKRHDNNRDKECPICKKQFFDVRALREHLVIHSEERQHCCSECNATFKQQIALKNHMKLHENKLSYQCMFCDSKFNQHAGLYSHMKSIHAGAMKVSNLST